MIKRAQRPSAEIRLTKALTALSQSSPGVGPLTVTELCRLAEVSRNSFYRYHTGALTSLRNLQRRRQAAGPSADRRVLEKRRAENVSLQAMNERLAALVDHYYCAYQEASALVGRRDRELAQLRRGLNAIPTLVKA